MATILGIPVPFTQQSDINVAPTGPLAENEEIGATGTTSYSGFLDQEEYNVDLQGEKAIPIYDRMSRSDGMVRALVDAVVLPIVGAGVKCDPYSDDAKDVHIAQAVEYALANMAGQSWETFERQAIEGMVVYGHSAFEPVFTTPDGEPNVMECDGEQIIAPYKLAPRLQKSIYRWLIDRTGSLRGIVQKTFVSAMNPGAEIEAARNDPAGYTTAGTFMYPVIPIDRLLLYTHRRDGANFAGVSMLRAVYRHWYEKDKLLRIATISAAAHGAGIRYAVTKAGIKKSEENAIVSALRTMFTHEKSYLIVSEAHLADGAKIGMDPIGILDMRAGSVKSTDNLIAYCDRQMAVAFLADFMTMQGAAVGQSTMHRDKSSIFFNSLRAVVTGYEGPTNRVLIKRIVDLNWPGYEKYPTFRKMSMESKDFERLGRALAQMVTAGILTPDASMENEVREMVDFAPLPEDEDGKPIRPVPDSQQPHMLPDGTVEEPKPPTLPPAGPAPFPGGVPPSNLPPEPAPPLPGGGQKAGAKMTEKKWHRELRQAEQRVDFAAIEDALTEGVGRLKQAGAVASRALAAQIAAGKSTKATERRLASALRPVLASLRKFGAEQVYREAKRHNHGDPPALPDGSDAVIAAEMAKRIAGRIQFWRDNNPDAEASAAKETADSALSTVARYSVTTPFNDGRDQAAKALGDQIAYAQYSALLDAATCDECDSKDGEEYEIGTSEYEDMEFPNPACAGGSNCRCVAVYVWADEA